MKRSVLAVLLVGLLVVQGAVAGVVVGDSTADRTNATTNDSVALSNQSDEQASATVDALNVTAANEGDDSAESTSNESTTTETTTDETPTTETTTQSSTTETSADESTDSSEDSDESDDATTTDETTQSSTTDTPTDDSDDSVDSNDTTSPETSADDSDASGDAANSEDSTDSDESSESTTAAETTTEETSTTEMSTDESSDSSEDSDESGDSTTTAGSTMVPTSASSGDDPSGSNETATTGSSATTSGTGSSSAGSQPEAASGVSQASSSGSSQAASGAAPSASSDGSQAAAGGASPSAAGSAPQSAAQGAGEGSAAGQSASAPSAAPQAASAQSQSAQSAAAQGASAGSQSAASQATSAGSAASSQSAVSPDAEFDVVSVDSDVATGEPGTVSVTIENTGEDATDAVVSFQSQSSDLVFGQSASTSRYIGDWEEGENRTVELSVQATSSADSADYPVQASVSYEDDDGDAAQSASSTFGVTVDEASDDLSVTDVDSDVPVGGSGNVSVTLENTGEDATDAVVNLQTLSGDLLFGRTANTTRYVGDWEEGESRTIEVSMQATPSAATDTYPVRASVTYEDDEGESGQLGPATFGVSPEGQQEFSLDDVSSDLEVGSSGTISGTITNDGPKNATDALLTVSPNGSRDIVPRQSQYVLGDLGVDESTDFELPVLVNDTSEPGERQVQYYVQYYDADGDPLRSEALTATVDIDEQEDDFNIVSTDTDAQSGEQGTLTVVMNNTGEDITDATVSFQSLSGGVLFGESANASQYVEDWDAGEDRTFEFDITAAGDAGTTYPMQASLSYTDADDDAAQAGPLAFGVTPGESEDDFSIEEVESDVEAGEQGTLSVTMNNTGENVTDSTVSFQSLSGGVLFGESANASQYVEDWDAGEDRTFEFDVTATADTADATYPMQASVSYTDADDDEGQSGPFSFGVTPGESADDFSVVSTNSSVPVGDRGPITLTLRNDGENATEATVSLQSLTGDITFGQAVNATAFVGEWESGEERRVTFNATASNSTDIRDYPFQASISYTDPDGDQAAGGPFTVGVTPQPEQSFSLSNVESTLRVGAEGNVTMQVTNDGSQAVDNAVVNLVTQSDSLSPQETEAAVGSLGAGESATVSFPIEVPDSTESGTRQLSFAVEYDNQNGDTRRSSTLDTQVDIAGQRDSFVVERANASVGIGSSDAVTLNVTNNGNTVVTNLNAKAYADSPLSLSNSEAYVARLAPGETAQISFDVAVAGSAGEGQYPLSVDFQYDTPSESAQLSEEYSVPVDATESSGGGLLSSSPVMIGLAALLVVLGIGVVWSRR